MIEHTNDRCTILTLISPPPHRACRRVGLRLFPGHHYLLRHHQVPQATALQQEDVAPGVDAGLLRQAAALVHRGLPDGLLRLLSARLPHAQQPAHGFLHLHQDNGDALLYDAQ